MGVRRDVVVGVPVVIDGKRITEVFVTERLRRVSD
jgi:hypothetical protein